MLGLTLLAVGRGRGILESALFDGFARRLATPLSIVEVEEKRPLPAARRVTREGELLLARLPRGARLVALDGRGRQLGSEDLAQRLGTWRDEGVADIAFAIGGADGLSDEVIARADLVLSLGAMTWPHMLVRAMLAEQLYRAETILAGHPYHRPGLPPGSGRDPAA